MEKEIRLKDYLLGMESMRMHQRYCLSRSNYIWRINIIESNSSPIRAYYCGYIDESKDDWREKLFSKLDPAVLDSSIVKTAVLHSGFEYSTKFDKHDTCVIEIKTHTSTEGDCDI